MKSNGTESNGNDTNGRIKQMMEVKLRIEGLGLRIMKVDPRVPITLPRDGADVQYYIELSAGAAIEINRKTGININTTIITPEQITNIDVFASLLLYGLRTCQPKEFADIDEAALLHMVSMRHMTYYLACIGKALEAIQPDHDEIEEIMADMREV